MPAKDGEENNQHRHEYNFRDEVNVVDDDANRLVIGEAQAGDNDGSLHNKDDDDCAAKLFRIQMLTRKVGG